VILTKKSCFSLEQSVSETAFIPFFFSTGGKNTAQTKINHYKNLLKVCSFFFCALNAIKYFLLHIPHLLKEPTIKTIRFGEEGAIDPKQKTNHSV